MAAPPATERNDNRRNQVMLGPLPEDFLRVGHSPMQQQVAADAQTAQYLQYGGGGWGGGSFLPPNVKGKLTITIVEAKLTKNYGLIKMDPYCRLRIGQHILETSTASGGGKHPTWNKQISCYIPDGIDSLFVELYDERTFTNDDRIAYCHVPLPEELFAGEPLDKWLPLSGKQGDDKEGALHVCLAFQEVAAPPMQPVAPPVMVMNYPPGVMYPQPAGYPGGMVPGGMVPGGMVQYPPAQVPAQQPAGPLFTDEDVAQIKDMFPSVEDTVIRSVLEANSGNKDTTINALLQMAAD